MRRTLGRRNVNCRESWHNLNVLPECLVVPNPGGGKVPPHLAFPFPRCLAAAAKLPSRLRLGPVRAPMHPPKPPAPPPLRPASRNRPRRRARSKAIPAGRLPSRSTQSGAPRSETGRQGLPHRRNVPTQARWPSLPVMTQGEVASSVHLWRSDLSPGNLGGPRYRESLPSNTRRPQRPDLQTEAG